MDKLNLQLRLAGILFIFFLLGLCFTLVRTSLSAEGKVREEVESISTLVNHMFSIAELGNRSPLTAGTESEFFGELLALESIRHIDIRIQSAAQNNPQENLSARESVNAPSWFVSLIYPEDSVAIRSFTQSNGDVVRLYADPGDEIEETWIELRTRLFATFVFLSLVLALILFLLHRWMGQLQTIIDVLDNVEQGDFSRRIPKFSLPEFRAIGDRINGLTTWLGASKSENERLTRKSILIQEQERRNMAQELHDSLGQSVSAIKAIAVSIVGRSGENDPVIAESASNIEQIADTAYKSVREMMTSLRPSVLDELGLTEALQQMTDDWNVHHEDTFCRLSIEGDYDNLEEEQQINLYRIIQEALTNISKYATAENVSITLSGSEIISLLIIDDGVGFNFNEITQSMGLTGIRDRVTLLHGQVEITSKPGKGVSIQIEFPRINMYRRRASDR